MLQRPALRAITRRFPQSVSTRALLTVRHSSTGAPATIVDRGFWRSLVPKPLRKENRQARPKSKDWNPATFFIVIFLLIGSMSIQMIALRNSFTRYMRQSEVKIGTLREVVERIQKGEKFDVEKALGTGEPEKEADWEEILKAIERDEGAPKGSRKSRRQNAEPTPSAEPKVEEPKPEPTPIVEPEQPKSRSSKGLSGFF